MKSIEIKLLIVIILGGILFTSIGVGIGQRFTGIATTELPLNHPLTTHYFLHLDESARTGFLNSEDIMIRFEGVEYPVAGSDDLETVYLIDVYKYPLLEPVAYRVDSWEEAVEFAREWVE